ncbi:hypothetical protein EON79_00450 [bacterium]|nr:MAG: hypothetical protein EON79_00450 [bacterium]
MANIFYATFSDADNAERAIGALLDHGVLNSDLSVIRSTGENTTIVSQTPTEGEGIYSRPENDPALGHTNYADPLAPSAPHVETGERRFVPTGAEANIENDVEDEAKHGISTTTPADAGAGALKGTAWGVGLGAAAALAALFIPGVGLVVGGGALAAALGTGAAMGAAAGAATGAVVGYLKDQGLEEHVASEYGTVIGAGGTLIAVNLPSGSCSESEGLEVLAKYGATNQRSYPQRSAYIA